MMRVTQHNEVLMRRYDPASVVLFRALLLSLGG
jgi:hypothetical protein